MYTVLWCNTVDGKTTYQWRRCETRADVAALLIQEHITDESDALIFSPDAEEYLLCPSNIVDPDKLGDPDETNH